MRSHLALALALLAAPPASAESLPYFRMGPGSGGSLPNPAGNEAPAAPAVTYNGWTGNPGVGNGPAGYFEAQGLSPPVTFTASQGLPPGITLSSDGALRGSYMVPGSYQATVTATGNDGKATSVVHATTVQPTTLAIRLPGMPTLVAGIGGSVLPQVVSGAPVSWSLTSGPDWASVAGDGTVSLAPPPGAGQASFLLEARDAAGIVARASSGPLTVVAPSLSASGLPSRILEGSPLFGSLSSNLPKGRYSLVSGPEWLHLSESGALSGHAPDVASAQAFPITFRATQGEAVAETSANLQVTPASVSVAPVPAVLRGGARIRAAITSDFGAAATYAVRNNPGWMSVSPDGHLVGTVPNADGGFPAISVHATWNGAMAESLPFALAVTRSNASAALPAVARQGAPFTVELSTDLANGTWDWTAPPGGLSVGVTGTTATVVAEPKGIPATYPLTFTYTAPDGAATAAGSVATYPDLAVSTTATGSIALGVGDAASHTSSVGNAIGVVTYDLLKDGVAANGSLAGCGFTFDPGNGSLTATAATPCEVGGLSIRANDAGHPAYPQTRQSKASPGTFSVSVNTPNAQDVTPVSGTVEPVSMFWVQNAARRTGAYGLNVKFAACDSGNSPVYVYDFGRKVAARSLAMWVYASGGGPMPITIKYSNDGKTWITARSLNPGYGSNYQWVSVNGTWTSAAARYWAAFYQGSCGSTNGYMTQFHLSN